MPNKSFEVFDKIISEFLDSACSSGGEQRNGQLVLYVNAHPLDWPCCAEMHPY